MKNKSNHRERWLSSLLISSALIMGGLPLCAQGGGKKDSQPCKA